MLAPAAAMAAMAAMVLAAAGAEARAVILAMAAMAAGLALVTPGQPGPEAAEEEEVLEGCHHLIPAEEAAEASASWGKVLTALEGCLLVLLPVVVAVAPAEPTARIPLLVSVPVPGVFMAAVLGALGQAVLARQQLEHEERYASSGRATPANSHPQMWEIHK